MTATPEERVDSAPTPASTHPQRKIKDIAVILACVAVAVALGSVFVVAASPYYGSTVLRMLHTLAQASAVALPVAALYGVPTWLWLSARVPARPLLIALLIAVSPLVGIMPGVVVFTVGLNTHADSPVFLGMGMIAGGAWSAPIATALYYLILGKRPRLAIALGGVVVILALLGWVSIWGSAG